MSDHALSFSPGRVVPHGGTAALHCRTDLRWNDKTEALYMEQVRGRARQKAREILEQALAEAESIREQARGEGFSAGQAEVVALGQAWWAPGRPTATSYFTNGLFRIRIQKPMEQKLCFLEQS